MQRFVRLFGPAAGSADEYDTLMSTGRVNFPDNAVEGRQTASLRPPARLGYAESAEFVRTARQSLGESQVTRNRLFIVVISAAALASPIYADGLWADLFRGLDLYATPSGSPILSGGDGTRVNGQRLGRLRIVPNAPGDGWDLELDRSFGVDSRGRPEVLDLGLMELQLTGATQMTAGFTRRGMMVGNLNVTANNLNYSLSAKTGGQDAQLTGTLNAGAAVEINQLGFYTVNLTVTNAGSQLTLDGAIANVSDTTDFDIGPIAIEGNIFFDGFVALLSSFGVDTTELERLTPDSPIDQITDAIQEQLQQNALVAGVSFDNDTFTFNALALPAEGGSSVAAGDPFSVSAAEREGLAVPEPSALILMAIGLAACVARRRR